MTVTNTPLCMECKHLDIDSPVGKPACKAFPDGIPKEVWSGAIRHDVHLDGDHGIKWEKGKLPV